MVTQVERLPTSSRRLLAAGAAGALLAPTLANPGGEGLVLCPLRRITGVWCPGCGMTRAVGWLARADWTQAWHLHPWVFVLALQAVVGVLALAAAGPRRARLVRDGRLVAGLAALNSAGLLALWIYRLTWGSFPID